MWGRQRKQSKAADIWEFPQGTVFYNVIGTTADGKGRSMIKLWEDYLNENNYSLSARPVICPICGKPMARECVSTYSSKRYCVGAHVASKQSPTGMCETRKGVPSDQVYIVPMCNRCNDKRGDFLEPSKYNGTAVRLNDCEQTLGGRSNSSVASGASWRSSATRLSYDQYDYVWGDW